MNRLAEMIEEAGKGADPLLWREARDLAASMGLVEEAARLHARIIEARRGEGGKETVVRHEKSPEVVEEEVPPASPDGSAPGREDLGAGTAEAVIEIIIGPGTPAPRATRALIRRRITAVSPGASFTETEEGMSAILEATRAAAAAERVKGCPGLASVRKVLREVT